MVKLMLAATFLLLGGTPAALAQGARSTASGVFTVKQAKNGERLQIIQRQPRSFFI